MFLSDGVDPKSQHVFLQAKGSAPKAGFFLVLKYSLSLKYIQLYMYFELYISKIFSNLLEKSSQCVTCSSQAYLYSCRFVSAECNLEGNWCAIECRAPSNSSILPFLYIITNTTSQTWTFDPQDENFVMIEENLASKELLNSRKTITEIYSTVSKTDSDRVVHYRVTAPVNFQDGQYPVIFEMPDRKSDRTKYRWEFGWREYLVSNEEIIFVSFNGAGSGIGGFRNRCANRQRLGIEISDFIDVLADIKVNQKNVKLTSAGLLGNQIGAHTALRLMSKQPQDWLNPQVNTSEQFFNCSIFISPVADFSKACK